jgi:uncharacterized protein (DUF427 family)
MTTEAKATKTYPRDGGLVLEPSPRWVRVEFNGEIVANSRQVLLLREPSRTPLYYFPREDVRMDLLEVAHRGEEKTTYEVRVGEHRAGGAAWSYHDAPEERSELEGYVAFKWRAMDHWYEEEEEIFVHPRDPYKRVDILRSARHVRVEIDGVTVADTRRPTLLFETGLPTRYYLPPEDVRMDLLEPTSAHTQCPYKGEASYWTVTIGEEEYRNIVWSYPDPIPEAAKIEGLLSFFNEKVALYVDGELQERPQTFWS